MESALMAVLLSLGVGRPVAWDVTVCTTVAASYVTAASQSAGAAAELADERRCLKYAELSVAYKFQQDTWAYG